MPRARTVGITAAVVVLLVVTALLVALPFVVRRVAVDQLAKATGRAVSLDRVALNVFTGRLALEKFRLAQRDSTQPAVEVDGLEVRIAVPSLLTKHVRVTSLTVTRPRVHVARLSPTEFDFSDLLARLPASDPSAKPSTRTVAVERIAVTDGAVIARDDVAHTTWTLDALSVDGAGLTTRAGAPGRLTVRAKLNGTPLAMDASSVDVANGAVSAKVTVDAFDVAVARPYVPASLGLTPTAGHVTLALDVKAEKAAAGPRVTIAGDARLDNVAVQAADAAQPFVNVGRVAVRIRDAQPLAGVLALDSVTIDAVDLNVKRAADGTIDLLALARPAPAAPATSAAPAATAPPMKPFTVALRELALRDTTVTLRDETVKATLALTGVNVTLRDVTWPGGAPLTFTVATDLPGAGRLEAKGTATLEPITADLTMSMRGAPIEPYQAYIPIPGRIFGTFNGESHSRFAMTNGALTMAVSQGKSWIDNFELRDPRGGGAPVKIARVAIDGIDFTHPGKAKAKTVTITKPALRVERDASGEITIRQLFAAPTPPLTATRVETKTPAPAPAAPPVKTGGFVSPLPIEIGALVIEDGDARFMDRTTKPAFAETLTRLAVRVESLSSEPGHRAKLALQGIVGGDSALDLKGELSPFGDLYADVSGELRKFGLSAVNPYAENAIAWIIERGTLTAKLHYTVERDRLTAKNEIVVENLHVAKSGADDEVQKRIGLPLGMIVALVTDADNSIRVNLPIEGTLESWSADLGDAIWTVVKNAVVNIVSAPFRAIGRLFKGKGDTIESMAVDPTPFTAGSATVAADAEGHLAKVADFLRRAPAVKLVLAPITTDADRDMLADETLRARIQNVQREAKLDSQAAAIAKEFARVFPGEAPPKSADEQLARLRSREIVPADVLQELATRRLDAVRDALAAKEGIPAARLVAGTPSTAPSGDGRVEFSISQ